MAYPREILTLFLPNSYISYIPFQLPYLISRNLLNFILSSTHTQLEVGKLNFLVIVYYLFSRNLFHVLPYKILQWY